MILLFGINTKEQKESRKHEKRDSFETNLLHDNFWSIPT